MQEKWTRLWAFIGMQNYFMRVIDHWIDTGEYAARVQSHLQDIGLKFSIYNVYVGKVFICNSMVVFEYTGHQCLSPSNCVHNITLAFLA